MAVSNSFLTLAAHVPTYNLSKWNGMKEWHTGFTCNSPVI